MTTNVNEVEQAIVLLAGKIHELFAAGSGRSTGGGNLQTRRIWDGAFSILPTQPVSLPESIRGRLLALHFSDIDGNFSVGAVWVPPAYGSDPEQEPWLNICLPDSPSVSFRVAPDGRSLQFREVAFRTLRYIDILESTAVSGSPPAPAPTPAPSETTPEPSAPAAAAVPADLSRLEQYTAEYADGVSSFYSEIDDRHRLTFNPAVGFGILHFDIQVREHMGEGDVIANLPGDAPVPAALIEIQLDRSENVGVWLDSGSRTVRGNNLRADTRYIFDLSGFWRK